MKRGKKIKVIMSVIFITSLLIIPILENKASALDSDFVVNDTGETITDYVGVATDIVIPEQINGKTITTIGESAFSENQLRNKVLLFNKIMELK